MFTATEPVAENKDPYTNLRAAKLQIHRLKTQELYNSITSIDNSNLSLNDFLKKDLYDGYMLIHIKNNEAKRRINESKKNN